jgi:hypothetical protein
LTSAAGSSRRESSRQAAFVLPEGIVDRRRHRSLWTIFTAIVVAGLAASLVGCASVGPLAPVAVSDVKSVAGTWKGVVYQSGSEPDYVTLTIREDGTYDVVSRQTIGASRGKGPDKRPDGRALAQPFRGGATMTVCSVATALKSTLVSAPAPLANPTHDARS